MNQLLARSLLLAALAILAWSSPAAADPAGPTDYETTIVSIEPDIAGVELSVIGGDSFLQLTAGPGLTVDVVGYQGEPYLRFEPNGVVLRNERSPSRWLNDDRFAEAVLPETADHEAAPEWLEVASDGRYAWHDHRAHWMNPAPPPGASPGDTILEAVIPLAVDGEEVEVSVRSTMLSPPSWIPTLVGVLLGAGLSLVGLGRARGLSVSLVFVALASLIASIVAVRSVPPETGPSLVLWALPLVALVCSGIGLVVPRLVEANPLAGRGLQAVAGVELAAWSFTRRDGLYRALIPSDLPAGLDRCIIAAAGSTGVVATIVATAAIVALVRSAGIREPRPAPRSAR